VNKTCADCMHYRPRTSAEGTCLSPINGKPFSARLDRFLPRTCPVFNAPSGLRWMLVSSEDCWWAIYRGPTCEGSLGFSRNLFRSRLSGGKSLEPTDCLQACARALVEAVKQRSVG
jgi:hypothetical protein